LKPNLKTAIAVAARQRSNHCCFSQKDSKPRDAEPPITQGMPTATWPGDVDAPRIVVSLVRVQGGYVTGWGGQRALRVSLP
jgi:hypothetical protein